MFLFNVFFFFKQKTADELRISDWSSDVCSSDLGSASYSAPAQHLSSGPQSQARQYSRHPGTGWSFRKCPQDPAPAREPVPAISARHHLRGRSRPQADRKSVVEGTSVLVRVDLGGGRRNKKKKNKTKVTNP